MSKNFDKFNDREEIYSKEPHKKKKKFRDGHSNKVRDFKRNYSQEQDREDLSIGRWKD
jgi:hypothetical protein